MEIIKAILDHKDLILFILVCLEQILPKVNLVDANSTVELIPELIGMIIKGVRGDYKKQDPPQQ